jgi:hypothetical protein
MSDSSALSQTDLIIVEDIKVIKMIANRFEVDGKVSRQSREQLTARAARADGCGGFSLGCPVLASAKPRRRRSTDVTQPECPPIHSGSIRNATALGRKTNIHSGVRRGMPMSQMEPLALQFLWCERVFPNPFSTEAIRRSNQKTVCANSHNDRKRITLYDTDTSVSVSAALSERTLCQTAESTAHDLE